MAVCAIGTYYLARFSFIKEFNHEKADVMEHFCQKDILSPSLEVQYREVTR